jgi:hypothetical protein
MLFISFRKFLAVGSNFRAVYSKIYLRDYNVENLNANWSLLLSFILYTLNTETYFVIPNSFVIHLLSPMHSGPVNVGLVVRGIDVDGFSCIV